MMNNEQDKKIKDFVLETLSFYEPMTLEKMILDFHEEKLKELNHFNKEGLDLLLKSLVKEKLLREVKVDGQKMWIKIFKRKRSWLGRLWMGNKN